MSSIAQIRGARGLLGWSQLELARAAGLSEPTVKRFETAQTNVSEVAVAKMVVALEAAGIQFTNGDRPGVRMRQWEPGEKVWLRHAAERHASTFGIEPKEIMTIEGWERLPGQAPSGHFSLRRSSGGILRGLPASHFERVPPNAT
jgi:transcriptional regulator with XRE-family HTH domain